MQAEGPRPCGWFPGPQGTQGSRFHPEARKELLRSVSWALSPEPGQPCFHIPHPPTPPVPSIAINLGVIT